MALTENDFFAPLSDLAARIRTRMLSPVELTEGYLARIGRQNDRFNAYATVTADLALSQARAAEAEIAAGRWRGPLHGIPWGAKDLLATKGIPTGWGTKFLANQVFDEDATVVRKLHDAGAVMLGKTHCVEFAGCLGYRYPNASVAGPGRNPWNPERWTGGSSSGSGAAVAAGLCAFALGTETWGSILCPSAFCGLTGLRPTYGLVSRAGGMVGAYSFDKVGPIARSAADCRIVLDAIQGPDPRDPASSGETLTLTGGAFGPMSRLKAALVPLEWSTGEPEAKVAFDAAVRALRATGMQIEEVALPEYPAAEVAGLLITVEALAAFEPFFRDGSVKKLVDDLAWKQWEIASPITGADVMKAQRMRYELQGKMDEFFAKYDVIVTPNFKSVAPPVEMDLMAALPYGDPAGAIGVACGLPALALPSGFGRDRLPVSFQLMGAPYSEALLLDLGEKYQKATQHHLEHPGVR